MTTPLSKCRGCLLGLAVGDAVGSAVEFMPPGTFPPVDSMSGGGPFNLKPGEWTDDTSMALCLASSLIEKRTFDPVDQMERYCRWWKEGYLSSNGTCFDIGGTVREALTLFIDNPADPYCGSKEIQRSGNGSLMRLAPVPLAYFRSPAKALDLCAKSSRTTHGSVLCQDACRYFGGLIIGALQGRPKSELLGDAYSPVPDYWEAHPLCPEIAEVANGSFKTKKPPQIKGSGYVVESLEAALWAFFHSNTFESGCLLAANLGDDSDTTAAIFGQIAGAVWGEDAIPQRWRMKLAKRSLIENLADDLYLFLA
jgi:ADP-ribosyl-[dinitrogen reductase] hydrolase